MSTKEHWDEIYNTKTVYAVSWFQPHAERSLRFIHRTGLPKSASIIDVGGGASTLVDDLLDEGYTSLTVLDISATALAASKSRLGRQATRIDWIEADITEVVLPPASYDIWHDRAVFHFLTDRHDRQAYVAAVDRAVKPGGFVIVATFAEDGPPQCSGLPVMRYVPDSLHTEFGESFEIIGHEFEIHQTPWDAVQKFVYCCFRKKCA
jgi:ubiquinone/menaquinone biosynthesis C-methylase UbiE